MWQKLPESVGDCKCIINAVANLPVPGSRNFLHWVPVAIVKLLDCQITGIPSIKD